MMLQDKHTHGHGTSGSAMARGKGHAPSAEHVVAWVDANGMLSLLTRRAKDA